MAPDDGDSFRPLFLSFSLWRRDSGLWRSRQTTQSSAWAQSPSRASRGAASRTVMRRGGALRESMFERSEFRFAAPTQSIAVSRSAFSPAAFSVPFLAGQKGDIPTGYTSRMAAERQEFVPVFTEPLGEEPSAGGKGLWPMRWATASTGRAVSSVVGGVRVWFVCAPSVWTRICSGIAFRREQGVVVAHAMGHSFDRADGVFGPGRAQVRSHNRPMPRRPCTDGGGDPRPSPLPQNVEGLP
jgi:hypothetical protein